MHLHLPKSRNGSTYVVLKTSGFLSPLENNTLRDTFPVWQFLFTGRLIVNAHRNKHYKRVREILCKISSVFAIRCRTIFLHLTVSDESGSNQGRELLLLNRYIYCSNSSSSMKSF